MRVFILNINLFIIKKSKIINYKNNKKTIKNFINYFIIILINKIISLKNTIYEIKI